MTTVNLNQSAYDSLPLAENQQREAPNHIFISPTNLDATSSLSCPSSTSCKFQDSPSASHIGKQRWHDQEVVSYSLISSLHMCLPIFVVPSCL